MNNYKESVYPKGLKVARKNSIYLIFIKLKDINILQLTLAHYITQLLRENAALARNRQQTLIPLSCTTVLTSNVLSRLLQTLKELESIITTEPTPQLDENFYARFFGRKTELSSAPLLEALLRELNALLAQPPTTFEALSTRSQPVLEAAEQLKTTQEIDVKKIKLMLRAIQAQTKKRAEVPLEQPVQSSAQLLSRR